MSANGQQLPHGEPSPPPLPPEHPPRRFRPAGGGRARGGAFRRWAERAELAFGGLVLCCLAAWAVSRLLDGSGETRVVADADGWVVYADVTGRGGATCEKELESWRGQTLRAFAENRGIDHAERTLKGGRMMLVCTVTNGRGVRGNGSALLYGTVTRIDYASEKVWLTDCVFADR